MRFLLLQPHVFRTAQGEARFERGEVIESTDMIGFVATVHMQSLANDGGTEAIAADSDRILQEFYSTKGGGTGECVGFGPAQLLPTNRDPT